MIDPRLAKRVPSTRRYVLTSVGVGLASSVCVVVQAVLIASIINQVLLFGGGITRVTASLIGLGVALLGRAGLSWVGEVSATRASTTVSSRLRRLVLERSLELGPVWLSGERAGELSLSTTRGISALDTYFGRYLPQVILAVFAPVVILAWVVTADWISAVIFAVLLALIPFAMIVFGKQAERETQRQWRRLSSLSAHFLDLIQGLPTLRALGRETHGRREVSEATEGLRLTTMKTLRVAFLSALSLELISGLGVGLVAMVLGLRLLDGSMSFGVALAILIVAPEVFLPLRRAGAEFHASAEGRAAAKRILDILDQESSLTVASGGPSITQVTPPSLLENQIVVSDLRIRYPGQRSPAVDSLSISISPGEHVAFVGPSGGGKSSILSALLCFLSPERGTIAVGDTPLSKIDPLLWRTQITWVPQHPHLFQGTVRSNLEIASPGASRHSVMAALEMAGIAEFIDQLRDGIETELGEGGLTLSAGERQRLAIARAILRDAPLVLLDEPGAHLDTFTQSRLRSSLDPWLRDRTVLIAAHRSELLDRVDRRIYIDAGIERIDRRPDE
ncbi:MAG: thiol reductant ABC exporter subunit CydD [Actinobacteria bacterium]|nr:thiol reductant ABC exporter subunit CydD [Actinomycetota bacterium]